MQPKEPQKLDYRSPAEDGSGSGGALLIPSIVMVTISIAAASGAIGYVTGQPTSKGNICSGLVVGLVIGLVGVGIGILAARATRQKSAKIYMFAVAGSLIIAVVLWMFWAWLDFATNA